MSLLLLLRSAVAGSTYDGPILDEGDRIENGEPFIALQIGGKSGRPLVLPFYGACNNFESGRVYSSLQVGAYSSASLNALTVSRCDGEELPANVPLLGVHIGGKSGLPLILASCEECDGDPCERLANRDPAYPTTVYIEPDAWLYSSGLTFPMALNETSPGSMVWQGSQTGPYGLFFVSFNCTGTQFYLSVTYNFFYGYGGADPLEDSLDPLITSFLDTTYGTTWTVSE